MCCEVGSDVNAFIKELAIRRVEHRFEIHYNESQHLAEGKEVGRLRQQLSFCFTEARTCIPHASSSLQTRSGARGHTADPFGRLGVSAHANCIKAIAGSEVREGANGVGGMIGVGGGNGNGNGVWGGNRDENDDEDEDGAGTGTRVEASERTQDGNGDGSRDENESSSGDGNGDENGDGNIRCVDITGGYRK